ncbi:indole-3-acetic acid-induced protein arg7 [Phtheirospermum japonicum]|uniref:Indole-3-acetic acid-induced protein arg7 n=1 Tax=Phtheirospermum japonicum TaxID=374723 RepID=A0A830CKK4_9LAMI|nr:indole-3-acetic acid-induced protein arg7 [Phtheirospermum japonicum]
MGQGVEQQRFVIPVMYLNHPLFMDLLKEEEEEYKFDHDGPVNIPCHVKEFRHVRGMIDKEAMTSSHSNHLPALQNLMHFDLSSNNISGSLP